MRVGEARIPGWVEAGYVSVTYIMANGRDGARPSKRQLGYYQRARRIRCMQRSRDFVNSCSQMRRTRQPALRNSRFTNRSRAMFPAIFFAQKTFPVRPLSAIALAKADDRRRFEEGEAFVMELFFSHFAGLE